MSTGYSHPHDSYDYTSLGAGSGGDEGEQDLVIAPISVAGFDADKTEMEYGFRDVPPGEHLLLVQDVKIQDAKFHRVLVDGKLLGYTGRPVIVRFCLPNDKRATISDFFTLPPSSPNEMDAYMRGIPAPKDGETLKADAKGGFHANKFFHFMDRLGLIDPNTKALTPAGGRTSGWKGRAIFATALPGKGTYVNTKGETKPNSPQIKMFSYRRADVNANAAASTNAQAQRPAQHQQPAYQQPAQQARPQPTQQPGHASVDDVLNNI